MAAAPAPLNGSSAWAGRYAGELRRVIVDQASRAPRSVQAHLGPSELGVGCDRQVVGKMAGVATTNHVSDPWPSIVGTAVHAWLADAFTSDNGRRGVRWVTEHKVVPTENHPGTADLYDAAEAAVVDWKVLGDSTLHKLRTSGPPDRYRNQLLLYGRGYRRLGLPVRRVVIAALPRTRSTLDGLYVWETPWTPAADAEIDELLRRTVIRTQLAAMVRTGALALNSVPKAPNDEDCFFCPYYRPETAHDHGVGCPGGLGPQ
jgi:hypothetical protein